jgi:hypothetical protein
MSRIVLVAVAAAVLPGAGICLAQAAAPAVARPVTAPVEPGSAKI